MRYLVIPFALLLNFYTCDPTLIPAESAIPVARFVAVASDPVVPGPANAEVFPYGVASGDPLPQGVIIWSMLAADAVGDSLAVTGTWEVATDAGMVNRVRSGPFVARAERHFRIKIDVEQLSPDTYYYYRFQWGNAYSLVGRTKTAPAADANTVVRLAVVSCNAYEWGFFNAFASLSRRQDLDAIVHLGDYIYEYGTGEYGDTTLGRIHHPRHEAVTLADYHLRYAQYRQDPDLRELHRRHPFTSIWDDHELANNSYTGGAENHQPDTEGDYLLRIDAARQIYYDWMPVREAVDGQLYRRFRFGRTVDLLLLDERLAGRTAPSDSFAPEALADSSRTMLGARQLAWLQTELSHSEADWRLIGNQVLFADLDLSQILPKYAVNLDAWDGYRAEKDRLTQFIRKQGIQDLVFLTGDTHCSWFFEVPGSLAEYQEDPVASIIAHELGTPSISSANYDELIGGWDTLLVARRLLYRYNPHLEYVDLKEHGYLLLAVDSAQVQADFYFQRDIRHAGADEYLAKQFIIPHTPTENHYEHNATGR